MKRFEKVNSYFKNKFVHNRLLFVIMIIIFIFIFFGLINKYLLILLSVVITTFMLVNINSQYINEKEFKKSKLLLKIKNKEYQTFFKTSEEALFLVEINNGTFKYKKVNNAYKKLTGLNNKEVKGETPEVVLGKEKGQKIEDKFRKCIKQKKAISFEEKYNFLKENKYLNCKLSPVIVNNEVIRIIGVFRNVLNKKHAQREINYITFHDSLTELYNRNYFNEELSRYDLKRQLPLSIIIGDVNGLKITNDAFGHHKGDELLKIIADILQDCCRQEDLIARWGGDEFVILLPQTDEKHAKAIIKRINQKIDRVEGDPVKPSITFGFAVKKSTDRNIKEVFKKAEDNMYKRKLVESKNFHNNIIFSLKQSLYESPHENYEHCLRLKVNSKKIGKYLELSENELIDLEILSELHDLGKVAIPEEILEKEEKLTSKEREEFNKHVEIGYQISKSSPQLNNIAEALLHHHERWDGKGYPHQLQGEEIPFLSRIITVVNEYDKLTHYHPHVKTVSEKEAIKLIEMGSKSQFDPKVVEIFTKKVLKNIK